MIEKVKSLEFELFATREQLDRSSSSKLDNMLNAQKSLSNKTGLGFVESVLSSIVSPTKFVPAVSTPKPDVRVPKKEVLATRKIKIDLSETKPKKLTQSRAKKQLKPQFFVTSMVELGILTQIALSCKQPSKQLNKKCLCQKHKSSHSRCKKM